ncbi:hypothetical protein BLAT2472_10955 [Burkholderia latens]
MVSCGFMGMLDAKELTNCQLAANSATTLPEMAVDIDDG